MNLQKCFSALLAACMLLVSQTSFAQDDEEELGNFKSRLWYGGSILLGFSGGGGASVFQFGLAPQVGYKIVEPLSVGPRVSFAFTSYKQANFKALSLFNVDAGLFLRYRVFQGLFLQGEGSNEWYQDVYITSSNALEKVSRSRFNKRVGAGWNWSGGRGGGGTELAVLYNFTIAEDIETFEQPWEYRFGFTWNF